MLISFVFQGYTPDKLPSSSCVMVPELTPPNPAKSLFVKVTKTLFKKRKSKSKLSCVLILVFIPWEYGGICKRKSSCPGPKLPGSIHSVVVQFGSIGRKFHCRYLPPNKVKCKTVGMEAIIGISKSILPLWQGLTVQMKMKDSAWTE